MATESEKSKLTKMVIKDANGITEKALNLLIPSGFFNGKSYNSSLSIILCLLSISLFFSSSYLIITKSYIGFYEAAIILLIGYAVNYISFIVFILNSEHGELPMFLYSMTDRISEYVILISIGVSIFRQTGQPLVWVYTFIAFIILSFKHYDNYYRWKFGWDMITGRKEILFLSFGDRILLLSLLLFTSLNQTLLYAVFFWLLTACILRSALFWKTYFKANK